MGPQWHDEHSYLIQMQMLSRGHLWMPAHPMGDFFESFHLLTGSVYASKYFPGASILFLPTIWFHWPYWVMPVVLSSMALAMTYRVIAELIDGAAGLLAAIMLISLIKFRMLSTMTLSQVPLLLLVLLTVWAWLHWRRNRSLGWAVMIGAFAGFSALTRPLDTLCYVLPIGVAMLFDLSGFPMRRRLATVLLVIVAAAPFLAVQLICDRGHHRTLAPHAMGSVLPAIRSVGYRRAPETRPGSTAVAFAAGGGIPRGVQQAVHCDEI